MPFFFTDDSFISEGTSNLVDNIIFEGADEATQLLRRQAFDEFDVATKGMYNSAEEQANAFMSILKDEDAWPLGYVDTPVVLEAGDTFKMALSPGQPITSPGGFGTIDDIPNVDYARNQLAIKEGWKGDIDRVVTYRVKEGMELPAFTGQVGPQIDDKVGKFLSGGGHQYEFRDIPNLMDYLEVVDEPIFIN